jgi:hypothetical protein
LQIKLSQADDSFASIKGIPTRTNLIDMLKNNIYVVEFNKLNGETRKITCTLLQEFLPKSESINKKTISVWDTNKNAWRSFRYNRVISVKKDPDEILKARLKLL